MKNSFDVKYKNVVQGFRKLRRKEKKLKHSFGRMKRVLTGRKFY